MTMDGMGYDLAIKYAPSGGPDVFESGGKEEFPKKTRRFRIEPSAKRFNSSSSCGVDFLLII